MIRAVIVDDEKGNIEVLKKMIDGYCRDITVVGVAQTVDQAVSLVHAEKPGLLFLDIEMPGKNAFDLIDQLAPVDFEIIFVTAFHHYALKAFRYSAIDYLLKPINIGELREAVEKARTRLSEKSFQERLNNFFDIEKRKETKIAIQLKDGYDFVNVNEIVCCSSDGTYTVIYLLNGQKLLSSSNLKHFEELLPEERFCRVHHSHLVNLEHAIRYSRGRGGTLLMVNELELEVSQRKRDELLGRFKK